MMFRALLLDLDGTLLGNDMDEFLKYYFGALAKSFDGVVPRRQLIAQVLVSTEKMMELLHREPGEPRADYRGSLAQLAEML